MKRILIRLFPLFLIFALLTACGGGDVSSAPSGVVSNGPTQVVTDNVDDTDPAPQPEDDPARQDGEVIPEYSGQPYAVVNGNQPFFIPEEVTTEAFEEFDELDSLGRCGVTFANVCPELMPTQPRESISSVKPTGWVQNQYDFVDGDSLYNRCHLIGFQLTGENANERNLITGTRYMNVDGMLPFENMVADYVKETGNHVLYRVTPMFEGNELVARGVLMEAWSVEDEGDGIAFCVYCYNVQPGVGIDYATGENWETNQLPEDDDKNDNQTDKITDGEESTYVLNVNSMKFHHAGCSGASKISDKNRREVTASREELIEDGYEPCGICNP